MSIRTPYKHVQVRGHEHINIHRTFYYLGAILNGASRYLIDWPLRDSMTGVDIEILLQRRPP